MLQHQAHVLNVWEQIIWLTIWLLQPSLTQYRSNISDGGCQSPTSPHSQPSYSPSQSPGLPPSWNNQVFELDTYQQHLQQQQQQTNALQQQFEHFNMVSTVEEPKPSKQLDSHQYVNLILADI